MLPLAEQRAADPLSLFDSFDAFHFDGRQ